MTRFIRLPNLPENRVKKGIISGENENVIRLLESYAIEPIFTQPNFKIDKFISNHADINIHYLGNGQFIADSSQGSVISVLKRLDANIFMSEEPVSGKYPFDCCLNFARVGNILFGKSDVCCNRLKKYCQSNGIDIINVRQGYSKCSVCIVNDRSIITDDPAIKKAADAAGFDCLMICKGDIRLNGHNYGFIGGASTLIDKNKLMFFGNLKMHTNYQDIIKFCYDHNCEVLFDESFALTDVGGMIPVAEESADSR